MLTSPLKLALFALAVSALPHLQDTSVPDGWKISSRAAGTEKITLEFGLRQGSLDEILSSLERLSDPSSAQYGSHLTHEVVQMLIAPSTTTLSTFERWVLDAGVDVSSLEWSSANDWVKINMSVAEAEALLGAEYFHFSHESGLDAILAPDYTIPKRLKDHIDTIQPTNLFPTLSLSSNEIPVDKNPSRRVAGVCGATADVACLKTLYNIDRYIDEDTTGAPGNEYSVVVFSPDSASVNDFQAFLGPAVPAIPWAGQSYFYPLSVNGGRLASPYTSLGSVAAQYSAAITFPVYESEVLAVAQSSTAGAKDWLGFINHALSSQQLSPTIIIPYSDPEHLVPFDVAKRVCDGFAALAARGVSVIVASGNDGVRSDCSTNEYIPQFPASCPYVTAVGGTKSSNLGGSLEAAASFSGGGFSRYFSQPGYQKSAVDGYFAQKSYPTKFNRSGRAYPDVSAFATNYKHILNGKETQLSSTGAAAVTFGSIITILNDALVQAGKPTLGHLNRRIYGQWSHLLNDILDGQNTGCQASDGFEAAEGWDPVTGYGTPNYAALFESLGL